MSPLNASLLSLVKQRGSNSKDEVFAGPWPLSKVVNVSARKIFPKI